MSSVAATVEPVKCREIWPQSGPQEDFSSTPADIALYGGQKGGGKSYALLMEPLRHIHNSGFGAVIFRRTYPQIMAEGGLWDTAAYIYAGMRVNNRLPEIKEGSLEYVFPTRARVKFAHMQYDKDRYNFDGAQIPLIGFDQLEQFSWKQFSYMFSINRSTCGIIPYMRATCNPDPDHWLRNFIRWWIDDTSGLPIMKRSGFIRWFTIIADDVVWGNSKKELVDKYGQETQPLSFTFIPASVYDNKILLDKNPQYLANLKALPLVERERLLHGNWNIRESAGMFFKREWWEIVEAAPACEWDLRYWDRAATETKPGQESKASWSAGVLMGKDARGTFYIKDVIRFQEIPAKVETNIENITGQDGKRITVVLEQDPGQAGKAEALGYVKRLAGYDVQVNPVREAKGIRARPFSSQVEAGNVKLVRGAWNQDFINEAHNFDGSRNCVSDQIDAASGAFHMLTSVKRAGTWGR